MKICRKRLLKKAIDFHTKMADFYVNNRWFYIPEPGTEVSVADIKYRAEINCIRRIKKLLQN